MTPRLFKNHTGFGVCRFFFFGITLDDFIIHWELLDTVIPEKMSCVLTETFLCHIWLLGWHLKMHFKMALTELAFRVITKIKTLFDCWMDRNLQLERLNKPVLINCKIRSLCLWTAMFGVLVGFLWLLFWLPKSNYEVSEGKLVIINTRGNEERGNTAETNQERPG